MAWLPTHMWFDTLFRVTFGPLSTHMDLVRSQQSARSQRHWPIPRWDRARLWRFYLKQATRFATNFFFFSMFHVKHRYQALFQSRLEDKQCSTCATQIAQNCWYEKTPRPHSALKDAGLTASVANPELMYPHIARTNIAAVSRTSREGATTSYRNSPNSAECQVLLLYTRPITQTSIRVLPSRCKDTKTYLILRVEVCRTMVYGELNVYSTLIECVNK